MCAGPHACDEASEIRDEDGRLIRRERCDACPLDRLDLAIAHDPVLHRAFDLDFALTAGVQIGLSQIDVEEWRSLKILRMERHRYEQEQIKKANQR